MSAPTGRPVNGAFLSLEESDRAVAAALRAAAKDYCTECSWRWPVEQNAAGRWIHKEPPQDVTFPGDGPASEWYCDSATLHQRAAELERPRPAPAPTLLGVPLTPADLARVSADGP